MQISQVALQLYTLRNFLKSPEQIAETLRKVAAIGYKAVQVSGMTPIPEADLNAILKNEGLTCCATHEDSTVIRQEPEKIVARLKLLNCRYTAYPFPRGIDWKKREDIDLLVSDLNRAGEVLRKAGQVLTYHNHGIEFIPFEGKTALDYIYDHSSPENLLGELDTYWVQFGGGNPASWCRKLTGRLPLLHLKDYTFTTEDKPAFASIGSGNLDWPEIISAADESGCEWFIVEQDTCPGDPFEAIKSSFDYIGRHLVSV